MMQTKVPTAEGQNNRRRTAAAAAVSLLLFLRVFMDLEREQEEMVS